MGAPGTWNARALWPSTTDPRPYTCIACRQQYEWTQIGDIPERCQECSKRHNSRANGGRNYMKPWDIDSAGDGTLLEQLDRILHWSPVVKRWLFYDGKRWVKGHDIDSFKIAKSIMMRNGVLSFVDHKKWLEDVNGSRRQYQVYDLVAEFKQFCERRMEHNV